MSAVFWGKVLASTEFSTQYYAIRRLPSCVTYVTKEHFVFVKRTLAYLAVRIDWRRSVRVVGGGKGPEGRGVPVVGRVQAGSTIELNK